MSLMSAHRLRAPAENGALLAVPPLAAAAVARARGGTALNLIVDNDVPKAASIRIPQGGDGTLRVQRVEFDRWTGEVPFEELDVADEERFASFGERVRAVLGRSPGDP